MPATITYRFREGARTPKGVTADQVLEERDRIAEEYGKATIKMATAAVLSQPDEFPALRAFGPPDAEAAFEVMIANGIRYAFQNVERVRVKVAATKTKPAIVVTVRELNPVPNGDGELVFERFEVMASDEDKRAYHLGQCQSEVNELTRKLNVVIDELKELGRGAA